MRDTVRYYVRPHPCPLPQERRKHLALPGWDGHHGFLPCPAEQPTVVTANETIKASIRVATLSLFLGERAGVRASVNTTYSVRYLTRIR